MMLALLLLVPLVAAEYTENCSPEVYEFLDYVEEPINEDVPVRYADITNKYATPILNDNEFMESITQLNRERIPERVVHAKGTGAFGYFESSVNFSKIINADFLNEVGKRTPIVIRFSTGGGERGSSDLVRDSRGWSIRFYTEEGNFDILGFHTPIYFYKDPNHFATIVHGQKRKPDSNLHDFNTVWDAATLVPESLNFFVRIFADNGIPADYKSMPGHGIHTYQVENDCGEYNFVRFHFWPDSGVQTLSFEDAVKKGAADPDYAIRDLYEEIKKGNFPSWTVSVQIIPKKDCLKMGSRCIDVTRIIPEDKYPLTKIGKLWLNKNAEHFENEIEKLALCPCNLVPGITGPPDGIFESRAFSYHDSHLYRLGKNHNKIPVNCPLRAISTYNRDGMPPLGDNEGDAPNYYPNSFGGAQPYDKEKYRNKTCISSSKIIKIYENPAADNFDQVADFYNELTEERRVILINNLKTPLLTIQYFLQKRVTDIFTRIHTEFGTRLAKAINLK